MHKYEIQRLHDLCFAINSTSPRTADITGDLPTVFYYFRGDVGKVRVDIFENGYVEDMGPNKCFLFNTYKPTDKKYRQAMSYLSNLKKRTDRIVKGG